MDLFIHVPFILPGEHTVLQLFGAGNVIAHIPTSVPPSTHLHLSKVKRVRVKRLAQGSNTETPRPPGSTAGIHTTGAK